MRSTRFLLPRIEHFLLAAIFLGIAASGPRIVNLDGDLPRHLLVGHLVLESHRVLTADVFSFRTVGLPSVPHEWLSQVLLALADDWLGLDGVVLLTALTITLTWGLVYRQATAKCGAVLPSLGLTVLGIAASHIHVLPRPHVFTFALLALWISLVDGVGKGTRAWWSLPLLMLLWVNAHGMFVVGIVVWGIYLSGILLDQPSRARFADKGFRGLVVGGSLSLVATVLSPSGPRIWQAIASVGSSAYITSRIPEYQSPNFHTPETWPLLFMLLVVLVGWARSAQRVQWTDILLIAFFAPMAFYAGRMIPIFAIVAAPIAAQALATWIRQDAPRGVLSRLERSVSGQDTAAGGVVWLVVTVLAATALLASGKTIDPAGRPNAFDDPFFPVRAVSWLEHHPQSGRVFNEFDWGGYLLLRLWPRDPIFMDGHTHIYGEELTREYERVVRLSKGWRDVLAKYDVRWVIVRTGAPLVAGLESSPGWKVVYQDPTASILTRDES